MCSDSGLTGRSAKSTSDFRAQAVIPARTATGRSSATNNLARGLFNLSFAMPPTLRGADARNNP
jgi:hypothetical protein